MTTQNTQAAARPAPETATADCRFCGDPLGETFVDLGMSPLANSYRRAEDLRRPERFFPLHVLVCRRCLLVQLEEVESPENIFGDYAYFSSYSETWLRHAREYVEAALERFRLGPESRVVEIASNDGYLLQYFVEKGIPVTGVEPAANVAEAARQKGIPTLIRFFSRQTAERMVKEGLRADLLIGNNVLAHVPGLNDFVGGLKVLLAPGGTITMEFPHLQRLIEEAQFDTIYHEHFSYFSFLTVEQVFARQGLTVFDVEEIPTHGGSLRIYAGHSGGAETEVPSGRVAELRRKEKEAGLHRLETYLSFPERVKKIKRDLLSFLIEARERGRTVAAYGAPAKGNTLLNYCGVRTDLIDYTVDRSPHKQGLYLPGTLIPILPPERIRETRPDYLLILPWNLEEEIVRQTAYIRAWGGRHVVPIPELEVL